MQKDQWTAQVSLWTHICFVASLGIAQNLPLCLIIKSSTWCLEVQLILGLIAKIKVWSGAQRGGKGGTIPGRRKLPCHQYFFQYRTFTS